MDLLVNSNDSTNIQAALNKDVSSTGSMVPDTASANPPAQTRVCILLPTHWAAAMGGAEYQVKLLLDELALSSDLEIWYLARNVDSDYRPETYEIRKIGNSTGMRCALDAPGIFKALREIRPHTIYCRVGTAYLGIAAAYCRNNNCKLVWHVAGMDDVHKAKFLFRNLGFPMLDKCLLEYGLRRADAIVAQSQDQVDALENNYHQQAAAIVRNFHPLPTEKVEKALPVTVVWVANLKRLKQPQLFVDVADKLRGSGAQFVMIGANQLPSREYSELQQRIDSNPTLKYIGALEQMQVNAYLSQSHVLVNTSVSEGFPNTFIQAWMREVAVVSLNADPDGLLACGKLGLFAAGNTERLADQISTLIADRVLREQLGKTGARYAVENHGLQSAKRLIDLII